MDVTEVHTESVAIDPGDVWEEADTPGSSLLGASWRGARIGFRWATYIIGAFAAAFLIPGLALMEFGLGTGHGFGVPDFVPEALGLYAACATCGAGIGALVGFIGAGIGRGRPGTRRVSWWAAANRPIRLFRRRPAPEPPVRAIPSRSIWRRWPYLIGVPVQLLMTGAFGAGAYLAWTVDRRLAEATAAADRDDPDWRLDDLLAHRDSVPYSENSAIVVDEALALLPEGWPWSPSSPGTTRPPATAMSQALERLGAMESNVRADDATAAVIQDELKKYREAVQIARTVMYYDRGRHELTIGPTVIDTLLPETQESRALARLLAADAAIRVHDGDSDGALDSCRAILAAGRSIGDEPFLISQLVRYAIGMVSMNSARRVLGQGEPSDAALARLQAVVLDELGQPLLLYGVRGERAGLVEMIRRIRTGEVSVSALGDSRTPADPGGFRTTVAPWGKLMYDNQMALALEWFNEAVFIAERPTAERAELWEAWEAEIDRVRRLWHMPYTAVLPTLMMPAIPAGSSAYSRYEAELGAMAILLAAERHRRKTGAWPESISAIDPGILPSPPLDPFSEGDYRIEHRDGRLFIYSIGPNQRDEHGAYDPKKWTTGGPDDVGAIGWDVDRRRQPESDEDEDDDDDRARPPGALSSRRDILR